MRKHLTTALALAGICATLSLCSPNSAPVPPEVPDTPVEPVDTSSVNPEPEPEPETPKPEPEIYSNSTMSVLWGDTNVRYGRTDLPRNPCDFHPYTAWSGEKVNAEAVIWAKTALSDVHLEMSDLTSRNGVIPASAASIHFLGYVTGDTLNLEWYGDCAARPLGSWPTILVADRLDNDLTVNVQAGKAQPVWISVKVPHGTPEGVYTGQVDVTAAGMDKPLSLPVWLKVAPYDLPEPHDWTFHLDLWQHPEHATKFANALLWSSQHFDYLRPLMKLLADSGQKVVTTQISNTKLVSKTKKKDGGWSYNYYYFDKWVTLMEEVGIDAEIDCYGIIPWAYKFEYFDEASNKTVYLTGEPGSEEFSNYWTPFLQDFKKHLQSKGWYDKTFLAFDERAEKDLVPCIKVIKAAVPDFKISHTGIYFDSVEPYSDVICLTFDSPYPDGVVESRRAAGRKSTYYTCCAQRYPNTFMASPPAEGAWIAWAARARDLDGYLRWSYMIWDNADPVNDVRSTGGPSGDRYIVYPDCRSSVRLEKIVEGIQDYEKTRILLDKWKLEGNSAKISELDAALKRFTFEEIPANGPEPSLHQARMVLEP